MHYNNDGILSEMYNVVYEGKLDILVFKIKLCETIQSCINVYFVNSYVNMVGPFTKPLSRDLINLIFFNFC